MYPYHSDQAKLIAVAKQGRQQLVEQMAREKAEILAQQAIDQVAEQMPASLPTQVEAVPSAGDALEHLQASVKESADEAAGALEGKNEAGEEDKPRA